MAVVGHEFTFITCGASVVVLRPLFHAWRSNAGAGSVSSRAKVTILPLTVTVVQLIQGRGTLTAPRHVFMVLSPFFYPRTDL